MVKGLYMDTIELLHFYRKPALTEVQEQQLSQFIATLTGLKSVDLQTEYCFYVQATKILTKYGRYYDRAWDCS